MGVVGFITSMTMIKSESFPMQRMKWRQRRKIARNLRQPLRSIDRFCFRQGLGEKLAKVERNLRKPPLASGLYLRTLRFRRALSDISSLVTFSITVNRPRQRLG